MVKKVLAAAAVGVIGLVPGATPALAQQDPGSANTAYAPTMLVVDASGSMLAPDPAGGTKMDAAKNAVRTFVTAAPDASKVGLTVYGTSTGSSDAEMAAGCQDVKVLHPAGTIDKPALTAAADQIVPQGYTPIGTSLRAAAAALPQQGPRSIVLVSDGLDTCAPPDPCDVARELSAQGAEIVVHAIGFGVDDPSRAQLTCIAQSTGGTYTDAVDGKTLEQVLPRVSAAALRNYAATGTPIAGTPEYRDAPVVTPGQYVDVLQRKKPQYYAVDVPDGATAYFTGTVSFPRVYGTENSTNSLQMQVYGTDGQDCYGFESDSSTGSSDGVSLTVGSVWAGAAEPETGSYSTDKCKGGGRYYFTLEWAHVAADGPAQLPLEVSVGLEPGVVDPGAAPEPTPVTYSEPGGPPTPVVGGGSFNVAAELPGSGRYSDTLQRGEYVFYRVKLDWGQGLAYRVRFGESPLRGVDNLSNVWTTLYTPYRVKLDSDFSSYNGTENLLPANAPAIATVPVRYANRENSDADIANQALAGWYYIAVKLSPTLDGERTAGPVPVELEVDVTGAPEPGPRYEDRTADDSVFGESGKSRSAPDGAAQAAGASEGDGISPVIWTAIVAGIVLVAGAVVAGVLGIRRTRR
ncbi:vWA domain-containing protein [Nocardia jinanensis]|nr:VWA domain-containing protein [Nocardia jinanensis]